VASRNSPALDSPMLEDHPLRSVLGQELHERPFVPLSTPCQVTYLAWPETDHEPDAGRAWISELCDDQGVPGPAEGARFHCVPLERLILRWERHTEFSSVTFIHQGSSTAPNDDLAHRRTPSAWLSKVPGPILAAVHVAVERRPMTPARGLLQSNSCCTSFVGGGRGQVWTDFRHHPDGFSRFTISDCGMSAATTGRLVQRLIELELYQSLALHGLHTARAAAPKLTQLEAGLLKLSADMTEGQAADSLSALLKMSAQVEKLAAQVSFRFSASRAYAQIVRDRCQALKEREIPGQQMLHELIERRFEPAMRTIEAIERRREQLAGHLSRAVVLLDVQVSTDVQAHNQALLASMATQTQRSLRLQETVEGLSIIAISYYSVSLIGYALGSVHFPGVDHPMLKAIAVPLVLLISWAGMKRIHRRIDLGDAPGH